MNSQGNLIRLKS